MGIFGNDKAENDTTYYNKATVKFGKKKFKEAIKYYDKALEINPLYLEALNDKGIALGKLGKHDEALKCYDKALEIKPNALVLLNKAIILGNDSFQRYEEKINCFDTIQKLDEDTIKENINGSIYTYNDFTSTVWNDKGFAFFQLNNYQEAIRCYLKALEINPNFIKALNNKKIAENARNKVKKINCPQCGSENLQDSEHCITCGRELKIKTDSKKCVNCGFENLRVAEFCIQCGKKLISLENNLFCLKCNTQINSETKFCHECGNKIEQINNNKICPKCNSAIDKDMKFCPECGENFKISKLVN